MSETTSRRRVIAVGVTLAACAAFAPRHLFAQGASTLQQIKAKGVVRVGWAIYYPNLFRDPADNKVSGVMVDYMALMGKALNARVEWVEDNTATLIAGLQSNKFDITTPLGITEPRLRAATFPKPLIREGLALLSTRQKIGARSKWQDCNVAGTRISVTLGSNSDLHVTRLCGEELFPVCSPRLLESGPPLRQPTDLRHYTLLHDEGWQDWPIWLEAAGVHDIDASKGPVLEYKSLAIDAACEGRGVALARTMLAAAEPLIA